MIHSQHGMLTQEKAIDGVDFKSRVLEWRTSREAPAIFRHKGYYYLMTSGCTRWAPNEATYHRSTMLFGPYEEVLKELLIHNQHILFAIMQRKDSLFILVIVGGQMIYLNHAMFFFLLN